MVPTLTFSEFVAATVPKRKLGYCTRCRRYVGSRVCSDAEGIWRCSKCSTKLRSARPTSSTQSSK
jgi:ribosomal protein L37AE/L43A